MKQTYSDSSTTIYETDTMVYGIIKDNSRRTYYTVTARPRNGKATTIATRCTWERAIEIIKGYEGR